MIILILALFISNSSHAAAPKEEQPEWFLCDKDDDCVNISFACAGGNVNKKYAREAVQLYRAQTATRDCASSAPANPAAAPKEPPFKVFCRDHKCGSQGRNPKQGFN
jgi:hypothetical protein